LLAGNNGKNRDWIVRRGKGCTPVSNAKNSGSGWRNRAANPVLGWENDMDRKGTFFAERERISRNLKRDSSRTEFAMYSFPSGLRKPVVRRPLDRRITAGLTGLWAGGRDGSLPAKHLRRDGVAGPFHVPGLAMRGGSAEVARAYRLVRCGSPRCLGCSRRLVTKPGTFIPRSGTADGLAVALSVY